MISFLYTTTRWIVTATSWFMTLGLVVLCFRADNTGQLGGFALLATVLFLAGLVAKPTVRKQDQR